MGHQAEVEGAMNQSILEDVMVDLLVDDVMSDDPILEFIPSRDAAGRFTAKGAGEAYAHGIMAAGRVAGMQAKRKGADREGVRAAIQAGMEKHVQTVHHAKDFLNSVYGKGAGDDVRNVLDVMGPRLRLRGELARRKNARAYKAEQDAKAMRKSQQARSAMKKTV